MYKLKIYEKDGKTVKREIEKKEYDLTFGFVMELMELLKISEEETELQILLKMTKAWDEVTRLLDEVFPGVKREEWKSVKVKELVPLIIEILKEGVGIVLEIPGDEKNQ